MTAVGEENVSFLVVFDFEEIPISDAELQDSILETNFVCDGRMENIRRLPHAAQCWKSEKNRATTICFIPPHWYLSGEIDTCGTAHSVNPTLADSVTWSTFIKNSFNNFPLIFTKYTKKTTFLLNPLSVI